MKMVTASSVPSRPQPPPGHSARGGGGEGLPNPTGLNLNRKKAPRAITNPERVESGTLEPWNFGTLELWNFGTLELWNLGTLEPWNPETKNFTPRILHFSVFLIFTPRCPICRDGMISS